MNIIFDIGISPNNVDDSKILNDRLTEIKEIVPDLEEIHFDGGYASADNAKRMQEMNITQVQTAVRVKKEKFDSYEIIIFPYQFYTPGCYLLSNL